MRKRNTQSADLYRKWPIPFPADSVHTEDNMADDPAQSVADPNVTDPNIIPPVESADTPPDRPISTILADSPTAAATPSADLTTDYTPPSIPADVSGVASAQTDPPVATESASITSPPSTVPADSPTSPTISPQSPLSPISSAEEPSVSSIPSEPSVPSSPPEATSGGSIQDASPSDQPSQVQPSEPSIASDAPVSQEPETASQSAEIKPEPPQGTQNTPLADSDSQKTSFGDLTRPSESSSPEPSPEPIQPPAPAPTASEPSAPSLKTSFGDLGAEPTAEEPTINIEPIEPPKPVQPPQPPLPADLSAVASAEVEAPAKEGQSPQPPPDKVMEAKADFSSKRQQALQTRRKKREDHLAKIIILISQKGKVSNKDVRDNLRVSQSTASDYLQTLVKNGKINKVGKAKATMYLL